MMDTPDNRNASVGNNSQNDWEDDWNDAAMSRAASDYRFIYNNNSLPSWKKLSTLKDAFQEREPIQYIIEGLFPIPSLSILYGSPGDFKSMLLMDAAMSIASGMAWLPPLNDSKAIGRKVIKSPVFWYDFDNGKRRCDERFKAMAKSRNLSPDLNLPLYYLSMPEPSLNANEGNSVKEHLKPLILQQGIKFLCIDNLTTISGNADENSADMATVMSSLRSLVEETLCACVIIHHQRKGNNSNDRNPGENLRGHSSINAAIDLALQVRRIDKSHVVLQSTKTRGADVPSFGAEFIYTQDAHRELVTAYFAGDRALGADKKDSVALSNFILGVLEEKGQLNQSQITDIATPEGFSKTRVHNELKNMQENGQIVSIPGEKNAKLYSLKE